MVIPTSQWEVAIEFQVCILNFAAATKLRRLNTTSLALDACDALQRPVAGETELRRWNRWNLQDARRSWKQSLQLRKLRKDLLFFDIFVGYDMFEVVSRHFFCWTNLLEGQLFRVQDQAVCCLPTLQWAFWTQASADEVLYIAEDLRRKCIKLYMANRNRSYWTENLIDPFIAVC